MKEKKWILAALVLGCLLLCAGALADGYAFWSQSTGPVYFNQAANREYYAGGYGDPGENTAYEATQVVRVISKSASIWKDARTNSKKLGSVGNGEEVEIITGPYGGPLEQDGFYRVSYKGQAGWINRDYCVYAPTEIVLMESNVPAYCAPDSRAKKVGSLSKLTRYTVVGTYDDYYIVNLRQASAFIPMDVRHYDSAFEQLFLPTQYADNGVVTAKTTLRTGPADWYAKVEDVKAGYQFTCVGEIDGWYMLAYKSKSTDGTVIVYLPSQDADVQGHEVNG